MIAEDKKKWLDTIATNYIIAQADGFQLGYAQALADFTENIIDYWKGSDDEPQQCILDLLVDLGVELGKRKDIAERNVSLAKERGYEQHYNWNYKTQDIPFGRRINLFTLKEGETENDKT